MVTNSSFSLRLRQILAQALPVLVAQVASVSMMLVDTALLGHFDAIDLAAAAVGGGIHVSVVLALAGILQAVAPLVAHQRGAGNDQAVAGIFHQGLWLALLLALPGVLLMRFPEPLLALSSMAPAVELKVRSYLAALAWGVPAALCYRTCGAFCNALGKPRPLMLIALLTVALHVPLAWFLLHLSPDGQALGVVGCGISSASLSWCSMVAALCYLRLAPTLQCYVLLRNWHMPRLAVFGDLLRLGLPMGVSSFVEITSFTLIALFVARLGAEAVAGHRIVANLVALAYMLPLSLAVATLTEVGRLLGARAPAQARQTAHAGLLAAFFFALLTASVTWSAAAQVIGWFATAEEVRRVALGVVSYVALYQVFDALQTVAAFALRAYKVTFLPMLIHTFSFWLIGLGGGAWLAFSADWRLGVLGFWQAALASVILAAMLLLLLLRRVELLGRQEACLHIAGSAKAAGRVVQ
jgi:MATE family multidrug resistance protein